MNHTPLSACDRIRELADEMDAIAEGHAEAGNERAADQAEAHCEGLREALDVLDQYEDMDALARARRAGRLLLSKKLPYRTVLNEEQMDEIEVAFS